MGMLDRCACMLLWEIKKIYVVSFSCLYHAYFVSLGLQCIIFNIRSSRSALCFLYMFLSVFLLNMISAITLYLIIYQSLI